MVVHDARCVCTACADARIDAALIDTGQVARTLRVGHALGPAIWSAANVAGQARADGHFVDDVAIAIRAARRWDTGI